MKPITYNGIEIIVYENGVVLNNTTQKQIKFHISNGYLRARIGNKNEYLHRLIAMCFISDFDKKLSINHKDGNKLNNNVNNLEVVSLSENTKHAHIIGLIKQSNKGESNGSSKLTQKQAEEIFHSNLPLKELSVIYNISMSTISQIRNKKKWNTIHAL
jgi:hypothetical protein